jgi:hypothetical protein
MHHCGPLYVVPARVLFLSLLENVVADCQVLFAADTDLVVPLLVDWDCPNGKALNFEYPCAVRVVYLFHLEAVVLDYLAKYSDVHLGVLHCGTKRLLLQGVTC